MKKLAVFFSLVAALAVSAPVVAQARHSADDSTIELRHGADDRAGDDKGGRAKAAKKASAAQAAEKRHGADDPAGDDRGGRGRDDGPNHQ